MNPDRIWTWPFDLGTSGTYRTKPHRPLDDKNGPTGTPYLLATPAREAADDLLAAASSDAQQATFAEWQAEMGKDDGDQGNVSMDWHAGYDAAILRLRAAIAKAEARS